MSKGLEALEKIKPYLEIIDGEDGEMWGTGEYEEQDALSTLEKELKDKEKFEELVNMELDLFIKAVDIKGLIEDYQKFKQALEIIRKNIGLRRLSEEFDYLLNMEEYKLLKEVLCKD